MCNESIIFLEFINQKDISCYATLFSCYYNNLLQASLLHVQLLRVQITSPLSTDMTASPVAGLKIEDLPPPPPVPPDIAEQERLARELRQEGARRREEENRRLVEEAKEAMKQQQERRRMVEEAQRNSASFYGGGGMRFDAKDVKKDEKSRDLEVSQKDEHRLWWHVTCRYSATMTKLIFFLFVCNI